MNLPENKPEKSWMEIAASMKENASSRRFCQKKRPILNGSSLDFVFTVLELSGKRLQNVNRCKFNGEMKIC